MECVPTASEVVLQLALLLKGIAEQPGIADPLSLKVAVPVTTPAEDFAVSVNVTLWPTLSDPAVDESDIDTGVLPVVGVGVGVGAGVGALPVPPLELVEVAAATPNFIAGAPASAALTRRGAPR